MTRSAKSSKATRRAKRPEDLVPRRAASVKGGSSAVGAAAAGDAAGTAGLSGQSAMSTLQQKTSSAATTEVTRHNITSALINNQLR